MTTERNQALAHEFFARWHARAHAGDLHNGRLYRQRYHFLLEFRDGKIRAVRECLDTHHAHDVWIVPAPPAS